MVTARVIGSGPNGLAAAVTLAMAGVEVTVYERGAVPGGGARSVEATLPGLVHDHCAGFHALAVENAFFRHARLADYGVEWLVPEVQYAHPLDYGRGAAAYRSVDKTARALNDPAWDVLFGPLAQQFGDLSADVVQPMLQFPRAPWSFLRFGTRAGLPASLLSTALRTETSRALFAGVAAHAFRPLHTVGSAAIGTTLLAAAHAVGWPVARGGSGSLVAAMLEALTAHGGQVVTHTHVDNLAQIPPADITLLNTGPHAAAELLTDTLPVRVLRGLRNYRYGPAAATLSLAVEGGIPWTFEPARHAGTVHVGGSFAEISRAQVLINRGVMSDRPFVLVGQQSVADPSRAHNGVHPVDAYAHVPAGYPHDATEAIISQLERFAPGVRDRIIAKSSRTTCQLEADNPNFMGGDIVSGANSLQQLVFRPYPTLDAYRLGAPGTYLCSAATPPGAGAHGMAGFNAARLALRDVVGEHPVFSES